MALQPKYMVVKLDTDEQLEDGEFFVIRKKDVFAAQALYGYAGLVAFALELQEEREANEDIGIFSPTELIRLSKLADACHELASSWQAEQHHKVPD